MISGDQNPHLFSWQKGSVYSCEFVLQAVISVTETTVVCVIVINKHATFYELEFATSVMRAALNIYCGNKVNIMQLCEVCESTQTRYSERLGTVNSLAICISLCNAQYKLHSRPSFSCQYNETSSLTVVVKGKVSREGGKFVFVIQFGSRKFISIKTVSQGLNFVD